jgi:hypothetical protein
LADIARLKITLDDVTPRVLRVIEVPFDIRLDDLHLAFQIALGWENYHLYEFRIPGAAWGIPDPDGHARGDPFAANRATLAKLLSKAGEETFQYAYDFGDGWEHSVLVEASAPADEGVTYPRLVTAEGRCPPEDVGGPWGYGEYLEAISNRRHARHKEWVRWRGPGFDPAIVDVASIDEGLAALAKRLARRKAKAKVKPGS